MDIQTFYAFTAGICFTLVGLWWNVVEKKNIWNKDEGFRKLATGVYLSFLIPGLMSMAAQAGVESPLVWRASFGLASVLGIVYTSQISAKTRGLLPQARFHANRWGVNLLYGLILVLAIFPGLAQLFAISALTLEGLLIIGLLLIGHGLSWELMMVKLE